MGSIDSTGVGGCQLFQSQPDRGTSRRSRSPDAAQRNPGAVGAVTNRPTSTCKPRAHSSVRVPPSAPDYAALHPGYLFNTVMHGDMPAAHAVPTRTPYFGLPPRHGCQSRSPSSIRLRARVTSAWSVFAARSRIRRNSREDPPRDRGWASCPHEVSPPARLSGRPVHRLFMAFKVDDTVAHAPFSAPWLSAEDAITRREPCASAPPRM